MSLDAYAIFAAVVEEKSFFRASERLNLSPSAISHCISNLEDRFHLKLFNRAKTGASLTGVGEELYPHILHVLQMENILQHQVNLILGKEIGTIRIGLFNSVCISWLPEIIRTFRKQHSQIEVVVMEGSYKDILGWISTKAVDIAFVSTTIFDAKKVTPLHKDRLICIAPKDFVPIHGTYVTAEDISKHHIIFQADRNNAEVERFFLRHNLRPRSRFRINSDQSFISLVECGFGLCVLQELNMHNSTADVNIFPIEPPMYREIGLTLSDPEYASPSVRCMYKHIVDTVHRLIATEDAL